MKRNLDLIRDILLKCEADTPGHLSCEDFMDGRYSFREVSHHISLLMDVDYIDAESIPMMGQECDDYLVYRLTMFGYDYLDSIRDSSIWNKTKERLGKYLTSASLPVICEVASAVLKSQLGI